MKKSVFRSIVLSVSILSLTTQPIVSRERQDPPPVSLISVEELRAKLSTNARITIIDVRSADGYADSTERIKGAFHVKLRRLKLRLNYAPLKDVPHDQEVVTYCACPSDESSIAAARILIEHGFKRVRALKGGWQEWKKQGGQTESKPKS